LLTLKRLTFTLEHAVFKITFVVAAILPFIAALALFLAQDIVAFKFYFALAPCFATISVLEIIHPFTFVGRSL
jgi:hypothetical protein